MIPYGKQEITEEDIAAVVEVLRSDFLTQGPKVPEFERKVAEYCGARSAIAVNSGTSALHIACLALGVGEGDLVWTSPITFVASANCARYCGADVDFVDIDPKTYNMSVSCLEEKLEAAARANKLPKVVIPVHLCGQSCDMAAFRALSDRYGFSIIEDASHGIGGKYKQYPVGSCRYSDITVFSFHPVKIITTAEGGMCLTNDPELDSRMRLYASHYITRDLEKMTHESDGPWYYQQIGLGYNYRMTELQAALGVSQLQKLDEVVVLRHNLAARYNSLLKNLPAILPFQSKDTYSSFHLYVIRLQLEKVNISHKDVFKGLRDAGIGVSLHYIPVHMQPYYRGSEGIYGSLVESEKYYKEAISLPMYHHLHEKDQNYVVNILLDILQ